jgi:oligoendopeptidase F
MKRILMGVTLLSVIVSALVLSGFDFSSADVQKARQRSEIDDKYKWRLEDIFADTAAWQADFDLLQSRMGELEKYKGRLSESAETLFECLSLQDSLNIILGRLYVN